MELSSGGREDPDVAEGSSGFSATKGSRCVMAAETLRVQGRSGEEVSLVVRTPPASETSRAATSWSRRGARPTPPGSGSSRPASSWTRGAISASTSGWRRAPRRLGDRRMCRQPAVHARLLRRLPDHPGQPRRGQSHHPRPARALLHVHRPALARVGLSEAKRDARASPCASRGCR